MKSVAVTAGYITEQPREEFFRYMDAVNVDLKAFTDRFYHKVCGGHLQPVLDPLVYIKHHTGAWLEITTLLIPGENDSEAELEEMAQWVVANLGPEVPWHFSAFHPDWKMLDKPSTPLTTLIRARDIAIKHGMRYAYTGNVHYSSGDSTYCHQCGNKVIGRDWYVMTDWQLTDHGECRFCGTHVAGVFDGAPGDWGAKRLPVRLQDYAVSTTSV